MYRFSATADRLLRYGLARLLLNIEWLLTHKNSRGLVTNYQSPSHGSLIIELRVNALRVLQIQRLLGRAK